MLKNYMGPNDNRCHLGPFVCDWACAPPPVAFIPAVHMFPLQLIPPISPTSHHPLCVLSFALSLTSWCPCLLAPPIHPTSSCSQLWWWVLVHGGACNVACGAVQLGVEH
jgi:hypothetical protein